MRKSIFISLTLAIFAISVASCKNNPSESPPPSEPPDSKRCTPVDIGEAADFVQSKNLGDDRLVIAHGLANPQALIWRDDLKKRTYYLARVMGTERKLYFLKPVAIDETPGVASVFKGHLLRWDHLDPKREALLKGALSDNYNISINPTETYIIIQGEKPDGCP